MCNVAANWLTSIAIIVFSLLACCSLCQARSGQPSGVGGGVEKSATNNVFSNCGGIVNSTRGYIHTPNFPHQFPTPIACRWLFHAPPGKKIVLYLTQFYLRESFRVTEFRNYTEDEHGRPSWKERYDFGEISFEEDLNFVQSTKPYLLIDFRVTDIGNIHLRVDEYLLDVYGFNITYEMIDEETPVRSDACTVIRCSFLGHCLASADFESYKCHCFPSYYGDECQYGPYCEPDKGINLCHNGGKCRYFLGSSVNTCQCPPGYMGAQCESKKEGTLSPECEALGCQQECVLSSNNTNTVQYRCDCREGYRLAKDNKTCEEHGRNRYSITLRLLLTEDSIRNYPLCPQLEDVLFNQVTEQFSFNLQGFWNLTITDLKQEKDKLDVTFSFFGEKSEQEQVWIQVHLLMAHLDICDMMIDATFVDFDIQPALHSVSLRHYDGDPAKVGHFVSFACKAKGSINIGFTWYKDGHKIRFGQSTRDIWETRIPSSDKETHLSILSIEKTLPIDDGEYTCEVSDWGEVETKSVYLYVVPIPSVDVLPMHLSLKEDETGAVTCLSRDDEHANFTYSWLYQGHPLTSGPNDEYVEKLAPIGSRLTLRKVTTSANYTCVVRSLAGSAFKMTTLSVYKENEAYCSSETYKEIKWNLTPANHTDVTRCPRDSEGSAFRTCACESGLCQWLEPSFTNCSSVALDYLKNELQKIMGGYEEPDVNSMLKKLALFLKTEENDEVFFVGNLFVESQMLAQIQSYSQNFVTDPILAADFLQIFDVAGLILQRAFSKKLLVYEQQNVVVNVMQLFTELRLDRLLPSHLTGDSWRHNTSSLAMINWPTCFTNDMLDTIHVWKQTSFADGVHTCGGQLLIIYRDVHNMFYNQTIFDKYRVNSPITYMALSTRIKNSSQYATLVLRHLQPVSENVIQSNLTKCASLILSDSGDITWQLRGCETVAVKKYFSICRCKWSSHYATLVSIDEPVVIKMPVFSLISTSFIVLCCIAMFICIVLLLVQLTYKRKMHPVGTAADVNIAVAMFLVCTLLVSVWNRNDDKVVCLISKIGLCCGFLVTQTTLVLEMLHHLQPNSRSHIFAWIMLLTSTSWGISIVVSLSTILPAHFVLPSTRHFDLCGISTDHWAFYILLTVITVELLALIALIVLVVIGVRTRRQRMSNCAMIILESEQEHRSLSCLVGKSIVTSFWLVLCFSSVIVGTMTPALSSQIFIALSLILSIFSRLFFGWLPEIKKKMISSERKWCCGLKISKKPVKTIQGSIKKDYSKQIVDDMSSGAFKAFIKPASTDDTSLLEKTVNQNSDLNEPLYRDSQRYTKEKLEQLTALLGSSLMNMENGSINSMFAASANGFSRIQECNSDSSRASNVTSNGSNHLLINNSLSRPDLLPDNHSLNYSQLKPARGISYIRVPGNYSNQQFNVK